ncbi:MAG: LemA family protein [Patescibacteria group bacterium]
MTEYNTARVVVPGNIVASLFGFNMRSLYKADAGASTVPVVNF